MKILVGFRFDQSVELRCLGDNVIYRPDLEHRDQSYLERALLVSQADVLLTHTLPSAEVLARWRSRCVDSAPFVICAGAALAAGAELGGVAVHTLPVDAAGRWQKNAFVLAEQIHSQRLSAAQRQMLPQPVRAGGDVALVGAGVVNLITAYYLQRAGYSVRFLEASADPRSSRDWANMGCTHGGGDARMFTLSEARHHLMRSYAAPAQKADVFRSAIAEQGWLCRDLHFLGEAERRWIAEFEHVPSWLPEVFNADIIAFNQESEPLWAALECDEPELFDGVGHTPTVLRLYSTAEQFQNAIINEGAIGSTRRIYDGRALAAAWPVFADAVARGALVGGLEVVGFTVNVHKFSARLVGLLESRGARFHWSMPVEAVQRGAAGVTGLQLADGVIEADHYVLSPGAYGGGLLRDSGCAGQIAAVVGAWMQIPNLDNALTASLKISRTGPAARGAAEGANIIVGTNADGESIINVSSGHGYLGADPRSIERSRIEALYDIVRDTAERYFPRQYAAAVASGMAERTLKYCVRPWTPTGLGLFELEAAANGGRLVITGGHNTGGFAQAPSIAQAVLAGLRGVGHRMHAAYHPHRVAAFTLGAQAFEAAPAPIETDALPA